MILDITASGKTTLVQDMACNSMFEKLKRIHWISKVKLSNQREAEIDSCFAPKIEFYKPQDEYDLKKTFNYLENLYRNKMEKKGVLTQDKGMGE